VGEYTITATLKKAGTALNPAVTATFTVFVKLNYTLEVTATNFNVDQGGSFDLSDKYILTVSDGSTPTIVSSSTADNDLNVGDIIIGVGCKSDYTNCDLFEDENRPWREINFSISNTATKGKPHTMMIEVQEVQEDDVWEKLVTKEFTITVTNN
jgi:hypothetical protein